MATNVVETGRRRFLSGLLAASLIPKPSWADAGSPAFLSAAATQAGDYILCGISADLNIVFQIPLPARGHAAAGHPTRPEAVAFARRPGKFAIVIDCTTGRQTAVLNAPEGRHFYGHGAFSADGSRLYTTENDYGTGRGRIGVWDASHNYSRLDEWDSGGIGPHDIKRLPGSDMLVVANGGIDTHPDGGRTKLNIPTMQPNLAYVHEGSVVEISQLPDEMHMNSIRHLAVSDDGTVAFGMQWQGDGHPAALVGLHSFGNQMVLMQTVSEDVRRMDGYVGSIAFSGAGNDIAATSPRGGLIQIYDAATRALRTSKSVIDVSGVSATPHSFVFTSGTGALQLFADSVDAAGQHSQLMFDNHIVALASF